MSLLFRELFKQYGKLICIFLLGICVLFVLIEGPSRAQSMAGADNLLWVLIRYFGARFPAEMASYLPVCCFLAGIVLLFAIKRNRELVALNAGAVSYTRIVLFLFISSLVWSGIQFFMEQYLGRQGQAYAYTLYWEKRGLDSTSRQSANIWFADGEYLAHLKKVGSDGRGQGFWAIRSGPGGHGLIEIISAQYFWGQTGDWQLSQAKIARPELFLEEQYPDLSLPLSQAPHLFFVTTENRPQDLPFWVLYDSIQRLDSAGINTTPFRTAWHECFAYALLCAAFTLAAAAIATLVPNLYAAILVGVGVALGGISMNSSLIELGTAGTIAPALAAWSVPLLLGLFAALRLSWSHFRR